MFKDLLAPMIGVDGDSAAVDFAVALAAKLQARLTVMEIVDLPVPTTGPWGVMQEVGLVDVYKMLRDEGEKKAAAMRIRLAEEPIRSEVRVVETLTSEPDRIAAIAAHHSDMVVVTGKSGVTGEASVVHGYIGGLLMESGAPVLMIPEGSATTKFPPRRVVVGWKPSREATRALHDALPFLQAAERVDVLIVNPEGWERGQSEQPGEEVAAHLLHHGVNVHVVARQAGEDTVGTTLMKHAASIDADLIVAGGYGHSRLREWVLGGVTRELLCSSNKPVFFSH